MGIPWRIYAQVCRLMILSVMVVMVGLNGVIPVASTGSGRARLASAPEKGSWLPGLPNAGTGHVTLALRTQRFAGAAADPGPEVRFAGPAARLAAIDSAVTMAFSRPVSVVSVESSFKIEPAIAGSFQWQDGQTVTFVPAAPLAYRTTYHVFVSARELQGRHLVSADRYAFTTLWPPPNVPFPFTLTFDDCGTVAQIQGILDLLANRGLHAIFFPTGQCRDANPWLVPTLVAAGHRVCNHSYSHPVMTALSVAAMRSQIQNGVSVNCNLFRPPYGATNATVASVAASMGYKIQLWDVDTRDWAGTPSDQMVAMIRAKGGVVLFHMHGVHTLEALNML